MARMTQKELKKSYFHCGPIRKGKILELGHSYLILRSASRT